MKKAVKKVQDGKLVKVELECGDRIDKIKIHGDFFIEPPEALEDIRRELKDVKTDKENIFKCINAVDAELIGFSKNDLVDTIMEASKK